MISRIAADFLVLVHMIFILYVVVGGILAFKWRWTIWMHLPCALYGVLIEFWGWVCPLTPLENDLRKAAGQAGYQGGFVEHYILPVVYPTALTRSVQIVLGLLVIAVNACVYGALIVAVLRRRRQSG